MTGFKEISCRLCLKNITDKGFQVVDDVTRNILDTLLLKLKFYGENNEVICNACRRKLNAAYVFKSTCINTNDAIIPHMNHEIMLQLDLKEIYMKENGSGHVTDIPYNHKICRLCMQVIKGEIRCIDEEEFEAIHKLVPEMNIMIVKDPVICKPCFDSLCTHNTFLKKCLEVEQRIGHIFEKSATENPSVVYIKTENLDNEFEINEMEMAIKTECVDIKSENEQVSDTLLPHSNKTTFEDSDTKDAGEEQFRHMWKCETCEYVTKKKKLLNSHRLRHKVFSEIEMYRCNECDFKTKYKKSLVCHVLLHKDSLQVLIYKCNACGYKSRYKYQLTKHQLTHNPTDVQIYECNDCSYKTIHRYKLPYHVQRHKVPSHVQMYTCDDCHFESRYKYSFIKHQLTHKDPSEVQMYKCNDCDYKTKDKGILVQHVVQHKDPSQVQMYQCDACDFKSRYKKSFTRHQLAHKDPSEVHLYKCNDCDYTTQFQWRIKYHAIKHKDRSCVEMYKCNTCDYEAKYKRNLKFHELKHKPQQPVFKCDQCEYETIRKFNLKKHQRRHI